MSEQKTKFRFSIISLWIGILIPIIAALIPYTLKYIAPEHKLDYQLVGPIIIDRTTAIKLIIKNKGEKTEKNVHIRIKGDQLPALFNRGHSLKVSASDIKVESEAKYSTSIEGEYHIISLGDLRPRESITLSVLLNGSLSLIGSPYAPKFFAIKSDDHIAEIKGEPDILAEVFYPFGFWMFVLLMILIGVYAIYYEYFMDPKKKEKMILDAIEKLDK